MTPIRYHRNRINNERTAESLVFPKIFLLHKVVRDAKKVEKHCARELFKPFTDSASLLVNIEKNVFRFRWGFSGGDVTMRACFGNFGHLWPALGPNPLTHSIGSNFCLKLRQNPHL